MEPTELREHLARHPFLAGLTDAQLEAIADCAGHVSLPAGAGVLTEGELANRSLLVVEGMISLRIHDPGLGGVPLQTIGPGEVMGWSWMASTRRWHFDAVATQPTRAIEVHGACLSPKLEADPALGFELAKRFLSVAQQRLQQLRVQLIDVYHRDPELLAGDA